MDGSRLQKTESERPRYEGGPPLPLPPPIPFPPPLPLPPLASFTLSSPNSGVSPTVWPSRRPPDCVAVPRHPSVGSRALLSPGGLNPNAECSKPFAIDNYGSYIDRRGTRAPQSLSWGRTLVRTGPAGFDRETFVFRPFVRRDRRRRTGRSRRRRSLRVGRGRRRRVRGTGRRRPTGFRERQ